MFEYPLFHGTLVRCCFCVPVPSIVYLAFLEKFIAEEEDEEENLRQLRTNVFLICSFEREKNRFSGVFAFYFHLVR